MNWSVSASRLFLQCPRKWYYREFYADAKTDDPVRKEAYFLNELSSIRAWRGKLVDLVITRFIIPRLNRHEIIDEGAALDYARDCVNNQLDFGKARSYRGDTTSTFRIARSYCAFFELEYGGSLPDELIRESIEEVETSLRNLMKSELMRRIQEDGLHMAAQRTLKLKFSGVVVNSTPDLIAFFKSDSPMIADWKVETPAYKDHWLQLGLYGVVLSRVKAHRDFPSHLHKILRDPSNIDLLEFQLLHNRTYAYRITREDVTDIENYIYWSASQMSRLLNGSKTSPIDPHVLPTTRNPEICARCNFRKICWRNAA